MRLSNLQEGVQIEWNVSIDSRGRPPSNSRSEQTDAGRLFLFLCARTQEMIYSIRSATTVAAANAAAEVRKRLDYGQYLNTLLALDGPRRGNNQYNNRTKMKKDQFKPGC